MTSLESLSKEALIDILEEYDMYIQEANDEDTYISGWRPVCLHEFIDIEYEDILEQRRLQEV